MRQLVAEASEDLLGLAVDLGVLLGVGQLSLGELLALVVCGTLGLAALLKSGRLSVCYAQYSVSEIYTPLNNILVLPANLVTETTNCAVLATGL